MLFDWDQANISHIRTRCWTTSSPPRPKAVLDPTPLWFTPFLYPLSMTV